MRGLREVSVGLETSARSSQSPRLRAPRAALTRGGPGAERDVREGGRWSRWQRLKNDALFFLARVALGAVRPLGARGLAALGRALGRLVHAAAWPLRARARRNLGRAMPALGRRERDALARASFVALGEHVGEVVASLREATTPLPFDEASRSLLREALAEGRGVVLPSAHLGPWERLAATLVAAGFPLTAIVRESYDPRFDGIVGAARRRAALETIPRGAPGAATRIVRVLRAGRVLGVPMDLRTRAASIPAPFFGRPAQTAVGPARLALRTGAAVVVCTVERHPEARGLAVTCTRLPIAHVRDEVALTALINAELERRVRTAPELWLWMHDRWDTHQEDAASPGRSCAPEEVVTRTP